MVISIESFLGKTIHDVCTVAGLKKICVVRGFQGPPSQSGKSDWADFVQLRFMNETGLESVFSQLDEQALAVLHFLKLTGEPQKAKKLAPFFLKKAYGYYSDQDLKRVVESLIDRLINNGVVLAAFEQYRPGSKSKWESFEFYLPPEFAKLLSPLKLPTIPIPETTLYSKWAAIMGEILAQDVFKKSVPCPFQGITQPKFTLDAGLLRLESKLHPMAEEIYDAMLNSWLLCKQGLVKKENYPRLETEDRVKQKAEARRYVLQNVPSGHGIRKEDLEKQCAQLNCSFVDDELTVFVEAGIHYGFLEKLSQDGVEYLIPQLVCSADKIRSLPLVLEERNGKTWVRLNNNYSLDEFLALAGASLLSVEEDGIVAVPCPKYIGRMNIELEAHPFIKKLLTHSIAYRQAFEAIKERAGKIAIHSGLVVIKMNCPDLESVLLFKYSENMVKLGEGCYAVSQKDLSELLQHGKKKGFTPKFIKVSA